MIAMLKARAAAFVAALVGRVGAILPTLVAKLRKPAPAETAAALSAPDVVRREGVLSKTVSKVADVARIGVVTAAFVLGLVVAGGAGAGGALYWAGHTKGVGFQLGAVAGYAKGHLEAREACREAAARAEAEAQRRDAAAARIAAHRASEAATVNAQAAQAAEKRARDYQAALIRKAAGEPRCVLSEPDVSWLTPASPPPPPSRPKARPKATAQGKAR